MNKSDSYLMFNQISSTYDKVNAILSLRLDRSWRKKLIEQIANAHPLSLLDIACGTGDVMLEANRKIPQCEVYGLDPAEEMLKLAQHKLNLPQQHFILSKAESTPFPSNSFDAISISFGIRNMETPLIAFQECYRLLKPGGKLHILEFSLPELSIVRYPYLMYLRHLLPMIGGVFSRNQAAYKYLNETIETFPSREKLCVEMELAGFTHAHYKNLTLGTLCLYEATK